MKKVITICLLGFFCLIQMILSTDIFGADYTVKVPKWDNSSRSETIVIIKTICIDGYKFLVTYYPIGTSDSVAVSTIQMHKQQGLNAPSTPMKCSD